MKSTDSKNASVTAPLLKDLADREKANSKSINPEPSVGSTPVAPPDLYQDSGGGYNQDLSFSQD